MDLAGCIYISMHIRAHNNIKENGAIDLRVGMTWMELEGGDLRRLEGRKGREKVT